MCHLKLCLDLLKAWQKADVENIRHEMKFCVLCNHKEYSLCSYKFLPCLDTFHRDCSDRFRKGLVSSSVGDKMRGFY